MFSSSVIAALDFDGKVVWRNEIRPHGFDVTIGSSPVLFRDALLMLCAMSNKRDSRIIAYKKADGSVKWTTPLPRTGFAHSTPVLIEVKGKPQLVVVASGGGEADEGVQSFDPNDGKRLWWCRGGGDAASAAFGAGILYCDNGRGGSGVAIDPTGAGDVTKTHVKWQKDVTSSGPVILYQCRGFYNRISQPSQILHDPKKECRHVASFGRSFHCRSRVCQRVFRLRSGGDHSVDRP